MNVRLENLPVVNFEDVTIDNGKYLYCSSMQNYCKYAYHAENFKWYFIDVILFF